MPGQSGVKEPDGGDATPMLSQATSRLSNFPLRLEGSMCRSAGESSQLSLEYIANLGPGDLSATDDGAFHFKGTSLYNMD